MNKEENTTVIICAAGMGTRLGIGTTKAMLMINGKPLIIRLLESLKNFQDVRIVVGFQAESVIETVNAYRTDVMFVFNYDYEKTGPAESVKRAFLAVRENVIIIDGDLLINPEDFEYFLSVQQECIGISRSHSNEPVWIKMEGKNVSDFSTTKTSYEWSGIAKIKSKKIGKFDFFVYTMLKPLLPILGVEVRTRDIDTIEDYEEAVEWESHNYL